MKLKHLIFIASIFAILSLVNAGSHSSNGGDGGSCVGDACAGGDGKIIFILLIYLFFW